MKKNTTRLLASALVLFLLVVILLLLLIRSNWLPWTWFVTALLVVCALALVGLLTQHRNLLGVLVNKENRLSFSRLQMLCWWVLLVSAVLVVAGARYELATLTASERSRLAECNKDWKQLDSVKPDNANDLDKGDISKALRETFRGKGRPLTSQSTVIADRVGSRWIIADNDKYYFIWSEGDGLTVYDALDKECAELNMSFNWAFKNNWLDIIIPDGLLAAAGLSVAAAAVTAGINGVKRNPSEKQTKELYLQSLSLIPKKSTIHADLKKAAEAYSGAQTGKTRHKLLEGKMELERVSTQIKAYDYANRHGFLAVADKPAIGHLFQGKEVGNWEDLDWAKVQALLLSAMLISLYSLAVWRMLANPAGWLMSETVSFPGFSGALAALLAVSLAGYEANQLSNQSIIEPTGLSASMTESLMTTPSIGNEEEVSFGQIQKGGTVVISYLSGKEFAIDGGAEQVNDGKDVVFKIDSEGHVKSGSLKCL